MYHSAIFHHIGFTHVFINIRSCYVLNFVFSGITLLTVARDFRYKTRTTTKAIATTPPAATPAITPTDNDDDDDSGEDVVFCK